jgi:hypothetical protein
VISPAAASSARSTPCETRSLRVSLIGLLLQQVSEGKRFFRPGLNAIHLSGVIAIRLLEGINQGNPDSTTKKFRLWLQAIKSKESYSTEDCHV